MLLFAKIDYFGHAIKMFMNFLMIMNKKYFAFSYGDEQEKAILISFNFWWQKNCIHDKGSGQVKSYHNTIIDKKYFAFSYGDEQEKATLLICSEGYQ